MFSLKLQQIFQKWIQWNKRNIHFDCLHWMFSLKLFPLAHESIKCVTVQQIFVHSFLFNLVWYATPAIVTSSFKYFVYSVTATNSAVLCIKYFFINTYNIIIKFITSEWILLAKVNVCVGRVKETTSAPFQKIWKYKKMRRSVDVHCFHQISSLNI